MRTKVQKKTIIRVISNKIHIKNGIFSLNIVPNA
jgi:hypothetical protein